jgi:ribosomal protein S18 acetylase RimI-like enzyme
MNKVHFSIRQATIAELPDIVDLENEAFTPHGTAESKDVIQSRLTVFPEGFIVLETDGIIAGYASAEKWLNERDPLLDENPLTTHKPDGRILCITSLAIRLPYRGRGFGLAILDRLIEIAHHQKCAQLILSTTRAQAFYSKRGFYILNEHERSGLNFTTMKLELPSQVMMIQNASG